MHLHQIPSQSSRIRRMLGILAVSAGMLAATSQAPLAQTTGEATGDGPVQVGLYVSEPFVMRAENGYTGMAVQIWEGLARDLSLTYDYVPFDSFRSMLDATRSGEIDVAVTNVSITSDRAEELEFTQPWYDAGLRIMVNEDRRLGASSILGGLADAGFLRAYAWLALVMLVATLGLTIYDRRFNKAFPRRWTEGAAESFYTVMSVATSGRMPSRPNYFGWPGRIMQAIWLVCGVAILAFVTSSVTSVMTALTINNQIDSLHDLPGKLVGVRDGTRAEDVAREEGLEIQTFNGAEEMVQALLADNVDAVIADAPLLEYYAVSHPDLPLDVVGAIFSPDKYGFALPRDTTLDRRLTVEILDALEAEEIEHLRLEYFGDDP